MKCAGSIRMSHGIADTTSTFAEEGTAAHALAERCGAEDASPYKYLGMFIDTDDTFHLSEPDEGNSYEVTEEMAESVELYIDTVTAERVEGSEFGWEERVYLNDDIHGTTDAWLYNPETKKLSVYDLKYGRGVVVAVEDNPQALIYAIGAARAKQNRGIDEIEIVIVQPRAYHADGPVRRATYSTDVLLDWWADIEKAAEAADDPEAPLNPGDWCGFCPAVALCPTLREKVLADARAEFGSVTEEVVMPAVVTFTAEELAAAYSHIGLMEKYVKQVKEYVSAQAKAGRVLPGYKLVPTRATRKWVNPDDAEMYLTELYGMDAKDIFISKLSSPAQIEKIIGKKHVADINHLIVKRSGGVVVAPVDDPRPAVTDAASEFSNVTEGTE